MSTMTVVWLEFVILYFLCLNVTNQTQDVVEGEEENDDTPQINSRSFSHCIENKGQVLKRLRNETLMIFEVLPGIGWDILRGTEMSRVLEVDYSECLTTTDMKYVIPDGMNIMPVKESAYSAVGKSMEHFSEYSSSSSKSMEVEGGIPGKLTASLSVEKQTIKKTQTRTKTKMSQISARYPRYKISVQPGAQLDRTFRKRLMHIAEIFLTVPNKTQSIDEDNQYVENFQEIYTDYLAELVLRDYGTHYTRYHEAGAFLSDTMFYTYNCQYTSEESSVTVSVEFEAHIPIPKTPLTLDIKVKASKSKSQSQGQGSASSKQTSKVQALGGPPYSTTSKVDGWYADLENNLVATDRAGDLIYNLINKGTFPELPGPIVFQLRDSMKRATDRYLELNTVVGCQDLESEFFNPKATVHDPNLCKKVPEHVSYPPFGGFYRIAPNNKDSVKNPVTKKFECPEGSRTYRILFDPSDSMDQLFSCVFPDRYVRKINASLSGKIALFGGAYSVKDSIPNQLTNEFACPSMFRPYQFIPSVFICIANVTFDAKLRGFYFGGFSTMKTAKDDSDSKKTSHSCRASYSPQILTTTEKAEFAFCFKDTVLPPHDAPFDARLPPFTHVDPHLFIKTLKQLENLELFLINTGESRRWTKVNGVWKMKPRNQHHSTL